MQKTFGGLEGEDAVGWAKAVLRWEAKIATDPKFADILREGFDTDGDDWSIIDKLPSLAEAARRFLQEEP